ncbi:MAG: Bax inhibitor-1 family protein [Verrucomicrobiales bacterium]
MKKFSPEFLETTPEMPEYPGTMEDYTQNYRGAAATAAVADRSTFIRRTYAHVAGAIVVFAALEAMLIQAGAGEAVLRMMGASKFSWLIVLGAFMGVSWLANNWAHSEVSQNMQYAGLGLYIAAEAFIFLPLLTIAAAWNPEIITQAALITGALVAGITAVAVMTKKDFSFLGPFLMIGGFIALGTIAASIIFGFNLGLIFTSIMLLFAGGSVLYSTSNILHQYRVDQHVAASLSLFASIALLFWYVLRLLMSLRSQ